MVSVLRYVLRVTVRQLFTPPYTSFDAHDTSQGVLKDPLEELLKPREINVDYIPKLPYARARELEQQLSHSHNENTEDIPDVSLLFLAERVLNRTVRKYKTVFCTQFISWNSIGTSTQPALIGGRHYCRKQNQGRRSSVPTFNCIL